MYKGGDLDKSKLDMDHTFSVYPNVLENTIYVDVDQNYSNVFYQVMDNKGNIMKEQHNLANQNTISLQQFPSGVYIILISGRRKTVLRKILKF